MARVHPHHHTLIDSASACVIGMLLSLFMAIVAMLHDCSAVLTDLPHVHQ